MPGQALPPAAPQARLLPAGADADRLARAWRARGRTVLPLRRRGVDFGHVVRVGAAPPDTAAAARLWRAGEAVFLPGVLGDGPRRHAAAIARSLAMFERLRRGGRFLDELEHALAGDPDLRYAGSTVDRADARQIERVFVDAGPGDAPRARDLWAMLAWIADDQHDRSLRIRFSSGKEQLEEWQLQSESTAAWADEFAARAFPECRAVTGCAPLQRRLGALLQRPFRLSERIVYNNAPGGGAVFHHDAEPAQLGVAFSQLDGHTAWFALARPRLAALLVRAGHCADLPRALAALDRGGDARIWHVLNRDVAFARRLSAHGAMFLLRPGDGILLPSHGTELCCWHSVFALGSRPSLAHSYGVFARGPGYGIERPPRERRRRAVTAR
jgi:hypothetical protein